MAARDVSFDLFPGEVLCVSVSPARAKSTLLSASRKPSRTPAASGHDTADQGFIDLAALPARLRLLSRTDWGFIAAGNARRPHRMQVAQGTSIAERLMARRATDDTVTYAPWRSSCKDGDRRPGRLDDTPVSFSGGMQQRRSRATWSRVRAWCSWTNRPRRWMCRCRQRQTCCASWSRT